MTQRIDAPLPALPSVPAEFFLNRELGILAFNRRVLSQARNPQTPLLERLRFLCIVSSNLDEFFEIRVAGLKEQLKLNSVAVSTDGLTAQEAYLRVSETAHTLVDEQYALLNSEILPALAAEGISFIRRGDWTAEQREWIRGFFFREVMPVLTPIGLDPSHPFPRVLNKSLNFAVELQGKDAFGRSSGAAIVQAPRVLPRVIRLPRELCDCKYAFVFLSSVLHAFVGEAVPARAEIGPTVHALRRAAWRNPRVPPRSLCSERQVPARPPGRTAGRRLRRAAGSPNRSCSYTGRRCARACRPRREPDSAG